MGWDNEREGSQADDGVGRLSANPQTRSYNLQTRPERDHLVRLESLPASSSLSPSSIFCLLIREWYGGCAA